MNYTSKYFKYKQKYLLLKHNLEGGKFEKGGINKEYIKDYYGEQIAEACEKADIIYTLDNYQQLLGQHQIEPSAPPSSSIHSAIDKYIKNSNFRQIPVIGDGNCFYYCCELYLNNTKHNSKDGKLLSAGDINKLIFDLDKVLYVTHIRNDILEYILDNLEDYIYSIAHDINAPAHTHILNNTIYAEIQHKNPELITQFNNTFEEKIRQKRIDTRDLDLSYIQKTLFLIKINKVWADDLEISVFAKMNNINIMIFDNIEGVRYIEGNPLLKQYNFFVKRKDKIHYSFLFYYNKINEEVDICSGFKNISNNLYRLLSMSEEVS